MVSWSGECLVVLYLPWFCLALLMRELLRRHGEVYGVVGGWV